ncbi:transposase [Bacillus tuaregi]|uniref:transposase n=1 Tax=Bacillus tuaregi TaxID=1816695 RepID=UPI0008F89F3C|nr:transposase [Bacillus tuaregi]
MPRKRRIWVFDHYYHITCRGNRKDTLFHSTEDFQAFLHILHQLHEKIPFEVASFCFMTNHYHLQLRSTEVPISKLMGIINTRYSKYYNTKYCLTGHVFEKRFFDKIIVDQEGMLELSSYIHQNPVEANIVKQPEHYQWSSYRFYKNPNSLPPVFVNLNSLLNFYEGTEREKRRQFCQYVPIKER